MNDDLRRPAGERPQQASARRDRYVATRRMLASIYPACFAPPGRKKWPLHPRIGEDLIAAKVMTPREVEEFLVAYTTGASYQKAILRGACFHGLGGQTDMPIASSDRIKARAMIRVFDDLEGHRRDNERNGRR